jgi:tetratricopeptide (TPR) repeat protein
MGKKEEGIALVKDALEFVDDDPLSLSRIGNMFYDHGDYQTAIEYHTQGIELYNKKIAIDPDFIRTHKDQVYDIYMSRGDAWEMLERYQEANMSYQKAVTIDPTRHEAWLEIGELQTMQKNWREATHAYEKAFAIDPEEKTGWVNLGFCYSNLKEDRRAVDAYTRGIKNNPNIGLLYNNRGFTYLEMKNYPASLQDLQKAIEVEPEEVMSHVSLGEYYLEVGNKEEAIAKLTEALNMENGTRSSYVAGYYKRGLAYFQLEQYEKAEQDLKYAVTLDATHVKAMELLGKTYYFLKKRCSAYKILQRALDIDARSREKQCTDAGLYLAKLTHNPCLDPNEK